MAEGAEALARWIAKRKREADRGVVLEASLLAGGFARYALRRLIAFGVARGIATVVHVIELTWLYEIFSAKPFVASLALNNVALVLDALFWGALESFRRRARELGPSSEAAALGTRWMAIALRVGAFAIALPCLFGGYRWMARGMAPSVLEAYALACGLRLAADVVLRTYYSGVFAFHRVHRPVWSTLVSPVFLLAGTAILWPYLAGFSFVVALVLSVVASRALLFVFSARAYRRHRIPAPSFRRMLRSPHVDRAMLRGAPLAGIANLAARLASIVLLAAVLPSLATNADFGANGIEPLAFSMHLASPLVLLASQWPFVFYHDEKRLEDAAAHGLARVFSRRLVIVAFVVAFVAWAAAAGLVRAYLPWSEASSTLAPLLPAMIGVALLAIVQLRSFARAEFAVQAASAATMLAVAGVFVGLAAYDAWQERNAMLQHDEPPSMWGLALAPWVGIVVHAVAARRVRQRAHGVLPTVGEWARALRRVPDRVRVWDATTERKPVLVAERIASRLGETGAVHRDGRRIVWFERVDAGAIDARRAAWLALAAGLFERLDVREGESGERLAAAMEGDASLRSPTKDRIDVLEEAHAGAFPDGFVVRLDRPPPRAFRALSSSVRQAIWRDALRAHRSGSTSRQTSGWAVVPYAPEGHLVGLFVRPRASEPEKIKAWRDLAADHVARLGASRLSSERRTRPRSV